MLVRRSSIGNDVLHESRSQFGIRICYSPELHNPALESPDQLINVEREPTPVIKPVFVMTRVATASNIGTRITVNKPTSKDLVEPFVTTSPSARRRRPTYCARLVQEIAHAEPQEFLETREVRTGVL
jgi:hypothetical protein